MGAPYFSIRDTVRRHGVAVFSGNLPLYRDISARVMRVLQTHAAPVEQYSIDEAFFSFTARNERTCARHLHTIKEAVERAVGVPVALGAGRTKTIAKCATAQAKRQSAPVHVSEGVQWYREAATYPIREVWGVGAKIAARVQAHGITTVAEFCALDRAVVRQWLGVYGARVHAELREQAAFTVTTLPQPSRSMMHSRSFGTATTKRGVVKDAVAYHLGQAAAELRATRQVAGSLRVMLLPSRHGAYALRGGVREYSFTVPTNDTSRLLAAADSLVSALYQPAVPYKKAGVILAHLQPAATVAQPLFAQPTGLGEVWQAVDQLNRRFGQHTVAVGRTPRGGQWAPRRERLSPHYTTRWSDIPQVMA